MGERARYAGTQRLAQSSRPSLPYAIILPLAKIAVDGKGHVLAGACQFSRFKKRGVAARHLEDGSEKVPLRLGSEPNDGRNTIHHLW